MNSIGDLHCPKAALSEKDTMDPSPPPLELNFLKAKLVPGPLTTMLNHFRIWFKWIEVFVYKVQPHFLTCIAMFFKYFLDLIIHLAAARGHTKLV